MKSDVTPAPFAPNKAAPPLKASAYCPHCGEGIHVYSHQKTEAQAEELAAWRLAVHLNAEHKHVD